MNKDPQATDFPNRQPYEGRVVSRDDPEGLGRVRVRIQGVWGSNGPWCYVIGGRRGGANQKGIAATPPLGADVLVFFPGGDAENPRVLAAHFGEGETPSLATIASDNESAGGEGDNAVYQDERVRIEVDARADSYGIRVTAVDGSAPASIELDMSSGQIQLAGAVGVVLKSSSSIRIEAPNLTLNGRRVTTGGSSI